MEKQETSREWGRERARETGANPSGSAFSLCDTLSLNSDSDPRKRHGTFSAETVGAIAGARSRCHDPHDAEFDFISGYFKLDRTGTPRSTRDHDEHRYVSDNLAASFRTSLGVIGGRHSRLTRLSPLAATTPATTAAYGATSAVSLESDRHRASVH